MPRLTLKCPYCNKLAVELSSINIEALKLRQVNLECGHTTLSPLLEKKNWEEVISLFGNKDIPYKYQGEGYEFARASGFRCLIGDEQGLGKTIQQLLCLRLHEKDLLPCLVIVKRALLLQYNKQILRWLGPEFLPQILSSSDDKPSSFFPIHIVTYDLLFRMWKKEEEREAKETKEKKKLLGLGQFDALPLGERPPKAEHPLALHGYKCVLLDECQQIKNQESKRAFQVREVCKNVPHIIASSGTPIKNHAGEYFTILNILRPDRFPSYKRYVENYCDFYDNGRALKIGGLIDVEYFRERTKDFIIRRTKEQVLPDLPAVQRKFVHCEFASEKTRKDYDELLEDFVTYYEESEGDKDRNQHILAKMAKLRHKSGINKVPFCTEYITDFLLDTNRKIVVFTHHQDVMSTLRLSLIKASSEEGLELDDPLVYSSDLNPNERNEIIKEFVSNPKVRVLIGSTLSMGEGVDGLQEVCSDCILLERQWTPASEEQVEGRFSRIGSNFSSVSASYILTSGTIDEYFTELIEQKRMQVSQTLDGKEYQWDQTSLMMELASILATRGSKKWSIK